jgi:hypothetical protein
LVDLSIVMLTFTRGYDILWSNMILNNPIKPDNLLVGLSAISWLIPHGCWWNVPKDSRLWLVLIYILYYYILYYYIYTPYYIYTTSYNNIYIIHSNTIYDILYIIIDQQTALWFAWMLKLDFHGIPKLSVSTRCAEGRPFWHDSHPIPGASVYHSTSNGVITLWLWLT